MNQWQAAPLRPKHLAALCDLGGLVGLLPRAVPSWRHSLRFLFKLVSAAGDSRAAWHRRARPEQRHHRRTGGGTGNAVGSGARQQPRRLRWRRAAPPADRRRITERGCRIRGDRRSAPVGRELGRHGSASARQHRRVRAREIQAEMAGSSWRHPFHAVLCEVRPGAAEAGFSTTSSKAMDNGWDKQPRVLLNIRHPGEKFVRARRTNGRLPRTQWTKFYLQPDRELDRAACDPAGHADICHHKRGVTFSTEPLDDAMEITGPVAAKLFVSSETTDADLFLVLRVFDPKGEEVVFIGSNDPRVPVGLGWLRASHRKLDPEQSRPYRPCHTHDEEWTLKPGEPVELDIEIWPTCIVVPKGYRLGDHRSRQRLRVRRQRCRPAPCTLSDERRRPIHPHQSGRPPTANLRRQEYAAFWRRGGALSAAAGHSRTVLGRHE